MYSPRVVSRMLVVVCLVCLCVVSGSLSTAEADIRPPSPENRPLVQPQDNKQPEKKSAPEPVKQVKNQPEKAGQLEPVNLHQQNANPKWDQPYLLAAYGAVWLVLLLYLLMLARRLTQTDTQLRMLEEQLSDLLPPDEKPLS